MKPLYRILLLVCSGLLMAGIILATASGRADSPAAFLASDMITGTLTLTPTPTLTVTITVTVTPTITLTPTATTTPTPTATPTSTPTLAAQPYAYFPVISNQHPLPTATPSPTATMLPPSPTPTLLPTSAVVISQKPAFDLCKLPSVNQMQTWWTSSPYYTVNLYLGGINLVSCRSSNLTADWVSAVHSQGWSFIPTWVGPQAPCSPYNYHIMSDDPLTAYSQGRAEADAAMTVAVSLGLTFSGTSGTVIYYDLEDFYPANSACRATVKSFLTGWVERLHELGSQAGTYGAGCNSYVNDWTAIPQIPDAVWLAAFYTNFFDPNATVWNVGCVSNSLWANHQRLRQYAAGHDETWGGLKLNIDSSAADGAVISPTMGLVSEFSAPSLTFDGPQINAFQTVTASTGWALADGGLLWTEDGGATWVEASLPDGNIHTGHFTDRKTGWLIISQAERIVLMRTTDGGDSWQQHWLPRLSVADWQPVSVQFLDADSGWLSFRKLTGGSFSVGMMLATTDGGLSWSQVDLPIGGRVHFSDEKTGWIEGGATGSEIYTTQDGGFNWLKDGSTGEMVVPKSLPSGVVETAFADSQTGWAKTMDGSCQGDKLAGDFRCTVRVALWQTTDRGATWLEVIIP